MIFNCINPERIPNKDHLCYVIHDILLRSIATPGSTFSPVPSTTFTTAGREKELFSSNTCFLVISYKL